MIAQCSTCGGTFEVDEKGAKFCPHCGTRVQVEAPPAPSSPPSSLEEPPRPYGSSSPQAPPPPPSPSWQGDQPSWQNEPPPPPPYSDSTSGSGLPPPPPFYGDGGGGLGEPPSGSGSGEGGEGYESPFERRSELGFVSAYLATIKLALFDPSRLFRSMRVDNTNGAFLFGWLTLTVGMWFSQFWNFLSSRFTSGSMGGAWSSSLPPELADQIPMFGSSAGATSFGVFLIGLIMVPFFAAIGLFISAALVHIGALIFGAANRGWNASFRAACFGYAPYIVALVPFCGAFIAGVWAIIVQIFGVYYLHKTTGVKASMAVLCWLFFCCACFCVIALLAIMGGAGLASRF